MTYVKDHQYLISSICSQPKQKEIRQTENSFAIEVVQDLLTRLDHYEDKCCEAFWLRMPYMVYVIASAYDCPTILLDPDCVVCQTFFPYRTTPKQQEPIVLAFFNKNHFVRLKPKHQAFPFPEVYGWTRNQAMLQTTKIPAWIELYQDQLYTWLDLRITSSIASSG